MNLQIGLLLKQFRHLPHNVPSDDLSTAQMLSQLPEGTISTDTGRGLLSFINNTVTEKEKVTEEIKEEMHNIIGDENV